MAWNTPSTWLAGAVLTAAQLNAQLRDNMKAIGDPWTAYTPALTGITLGNGTITGRYAAAGKLILWSAKLTLGTTSSVTGNLTIGLPVACRVLAPRSPLGRAALNASGAIRMWDAVYGDATNRVYLCDVNGSVATAGTPWAWTNGQTVEVNGVYEGG